MIGQALNRVDGPLKVAGRATYAYEHWEAGQPLYGFIVGATIGKGRITRIDTARAERSPGVHMVMTHLNAPAQGSPDLSMRIEYWRAYPALSSPDVRHYGQPVALVVATTFEQARAANAARMVSAWIRSLEPNPPPTYGVMMWIRSGSISSVLAIEARAASTICVLTWTIRSSPCGTTRQACGSIGWESSYGVE